MREKPIHGEGREAAGLDPHAPRRQHTATGSWQHGPRPGRPPARVGWLWAAVYLVGMAAAAISGSAFIIGGLLAGANGWGAVVLAATIPTAAILWVITITLVQRLHDRYQQ